jgi:hypothetical protein
MRFAKSQETADENVVPGQRLLEMPAHESLTRQGPLPRIQSALEGRSGWRPAGNMQMQGDPCLIRLGPPRHAPKMRIGVTPKQGVSPTNSIGSPHALIPATFRVVMVLIMGKGM